MAGVFEIEIGTSYLPNLLEALGLEDAEEEIREELNMEEEERRREWIDIKYKKDMIIQIRLE